MATNAQKLERARRTRAMLEQASTIPLADLPSRAGSTLRVGDRVRLVNLRPPFGGLTGEYDRLDTDLEAKEFGGVGRNIWVRTDDTVGRTRHFACHPGWVEPLGAEHTNLQPAEPSASESRASGVVGDSLVDEAAAVLGTSSEADTVRKALEWVVRGEALRELASWDLDVEEGA
jgi:hypothetical protein